MPVFIAIPCSLVMPGTVRTMVCHCAPPPVMIGPIISLCLSLSSSDERDNTIAELYDRTGSASSQIRL